MSLYRKKYGKPNPFSVVAEKCTVVHDTHTSGSSDNQSQPLVGSPPAGNANNLKPPYDNVSSRAAPLDVCSAEPLQNLPRTTPSTHPLTLSQLGSYATPALVSLGSPAPVLSSGTGPFLSVPHTDLVTPQSLHALSSPQTPTSSFKTPCLLSAFPASYTSTRSVSGVALASLDAPASSTARVAPHTSTTTNSCISSPGAGPSATAPRARSLYRRKQAVVTASTPSLAVSAAASPIATPTSLQSSTLHPSGSPAPTPGYHGLPTNSPTQSARATPIHTLAQAVPTHTASAAELSPLAALSSPAAVIASTALPLVNEPDTSPVTSPVAPRALSQTASPNTLPVALPVDVPVAEPLPSAPSRDPVVPGYSSPVILASTTPTSPLTGPLPTLAPHLLRTPLLPAHASLLASTTLSRPPSPLHIRSPTSVAEPLDGPINRECFAPPLPPLGSLLWPALAQALPQPLRTLCPPAVYPPFPYAHPHAHADAHASAPADTATNADACAALPLGPPLHALYPSLLAAPTDTADTDAPIPGQPLPVPLPAYLPLLARTLVPSAAAHYPILARRLVRVQVLSQPIVEPHGQPPEGHVMLGGKLYAAADVAVPGNARDDAEEMLGGAGEEVDGTAVRECAMTAAATRTSAPLATHSPSFAVALDPPLPPLLQNTPHAPGAKGYQVAFLARDLGALEQLHGVHVQRAQNRAGAAEEEEECDERADDECSDGCLCSCPHADAYRAQELLAAAAREVTSAASAASSLAHISAGEVEGAASLSPSSTATEAAFSAVPSLPALAALMARERAAAAAHGEEVHAAGCQRAVTRSRAGTTVGAAEAQGHVAADVDTRVDVVAAVTAAEAISKRAGSALVDSLAGACPCGLVVVCVRDEWAQQIMPELVTLPARASEGKSMDCSPANASAERASTTAPASSPQAWVSRVLRVGDVVHLIAPTPLALPLTRTESIAVPVNCLNRHQDSDMSGALDAIDERTAGSETVPASTTVKLPLAVPGAPELLWALRHLPAPHLALLPSGRAPVGVSAATEELLQAVARGGVEALRPLTTHTTDSTTAVPDATTTDQGKVIIDSGETQGEARNEAEKPRQMQVVNPATVTRGSGLGSYPLLSLMPHTSADAGASPPFPASLTPISPPAAAMSSVMPTLHNILAFAAASPLAWRCTQRFLRTYWPIATLPRRVWAALVQLSLSRGERAYNDHSANAVSSSMPTRTSPAAVSVHMELLRQAMGLRTALAAASVVSERSVDGTTTTTESPSLPSFPLAYPAVLPAPPPVLVVDSSSLMVLAPHVLLTATSLASAVQCPRQAVIKEVLGGDEGTGGASRTSWADTLRRIALFETWDRAGGGKTTEEADTQQGIREDGATGVMDAIISARDSAHTTSHPSGVGRVRQVTVRLPCDLSFAALQGNVAHEVVQSALASGRFGRLRLAEVAGQVLRRSVEALVAAQCALRVFHGRESVQVAAEMREVEPCLTRMAQLRGEYTNDTLSAETEEALQTRKRKRESAAGSGDVLSNDTVSATPSSPRLPVLLRGRTRSILSQICAYLAPLLCSLGTWRRASVRYGLSAHTARRSECLWRGRTGFMRAAIEDKTELEVEAELRATAVLTGRGTGFPQNSNCVLAQPSLALSATTCNMVEAPAIESEAWSVEVGLRGRIDAVVVAESEQHRKERWVREGKKSRWFSVTTSTDNDGDAVGPSGQAAGGSGWGNQPRGGKASAEASQLSGVEVCVDDYSAATTASRCVIAPLEIKSGSYLSEGYRAQALAYALVLERRYGVQVPESLLWLLKDDHKTKAKKARFGERERAALRSLARRRIDVATRALELLQSNIGGATATDSPSTVASALSTETSTQPCIGTTGIDDWRNVARGALGMTVAPSHVTTVPLSAHALSCGASSDSDEEGATYDASAPADALGDQPAGVTADAQQQLSRALVALIRGAAMVLRYARRGDAPFALPPQDTAAAPDATVVTTTSASLAAALQVARARAGVDGAGWCLPAVARQAGFAANGYNAESYVRSVVHMGLLGDSAGGGGGCVPAARVPRFLVSGDGFESASTCSSRPTTSRTDITSHATCAVAVRPPFSAYNAALVHGYRPEEEAETAVEMRAFTAGQRECVRQELLLLRRRLAKERARVHTMTERVLVWEAALAGSQSSPSSSASPPLGLSSAAPAPWSSDAALVFWLARQQDLQEVATTRLSRCKDARSGICSLDAMAPAACATRPPAPLDSDSDESSNFAAECSGGVFRVSFPKPAYLSLLVAAERACVEAIVQSKVDVSRALTARLMDDVEGQGCGFNAAPDCSDVPAVNARSSSPQRVREQPTASARCDDDTAFWDMLPADVREAAAATGRMESVRSDQFTLSHILRARNSAAVALARLSEGVQEKTRQRPEETEREYEGVQRSNPQRTCQRGLDVETNEPAPLADLEDVISTLTYDTASSPLPPSRTPPAPQYSLRVVDSFFGIECAEIVSNDTYTSQAATQGSSFDRRTPPLVSSVWPSVIADKRTCAEHCYVSHLCRALYYAEENAKYCPGALPIAAAAAAEETEEDVVVSRAAATSPTCSPTRTARARQPRAHLCVEQEEDSAEAMTADDPQTMQAGTSAAMASASPAHAASTSAAARKIISSPPPPLYPPSHAGWRVHPLDERSWRELEELAAAQCSASGESGEEEVEATSVSKCSTAARTRAANTTTHPALQVPPLALPSTLATAFVLRWWWLLQLEAGNSFTARAHAWGHRPMPALAPSWLDSTAGVATRCVIGVADSTAALHGGVRREDVDEPATTATGPLPDISERVARLFARALWRSAHHTPRLALTHALITASSLLLVDVDDMCSTLHDTYADITKTPQLGVEETSAAATTAVTTARPPPHGGADAHSFPSTFSPRRVYEGASFSWFQWMPSGPACVTPTIAARMRRMPADAVPDGFTARVPFFMASPSLPGAPLESAGLPTTAPDAALLPPVRPRRLLSLMHTQTPGLSALPIPRASCLPSRAASLSYAPYPFFDGLSPVVVPALTTTSADSAARHYTLPHRSQLLLPPMLPSSPQASTYDAHACPRAHLALVTVRCVDGVWYHHFKPWAAIAAATVTSAPTSLHEEHAAGRLQRTRTLATPRRPRATKQDSVRSTPLLPVPTGDATSQHAPPSTVYSQLTPLPPSQHTRVWGHTDAARPHARSATSATASLRASGLNEGDLVAVHVRPLCIATHAYHALHALPQRVVSAHTPHSAGDAVALYLRDTDALAPWLSPWRAATEAAVASDAQLNGVTANSVRDPVTDAGISADVDKNNSSAAYTPFPARAQADWGVATGRVVRVDAAEVVVCISSGESLFSPLEHHDALRATAQAMQRAKAAAKTAAASQSVGIPAASTHASGESAASARSALLAHVDAQTGLYTGPLHANPAPLVPAVYMLVKEGSRASLREAQCAMAYLLSDGSKEAVVRAQPEEVRHWATGGSTWEYECLLSHDPLRVCAVAEGVAAGDASAHPSAHGATKSPSSVVDSVTLLPSARLEAEAGLVVIATETRLASQLRCQMAGDGLSVYTEMEAAADADDEWVRPKTSASVAGEDAERQVCLGPQSILAPSCKQQFTLSSAGTLATTRAMTACNRASSLTGCGPVSERATSEALWWAVPGCAPLSTNQTPAAMSTARCLRCELRARGVDERQATAALRQVGALSDGYGLTVLSNVGLPLFCCCSVNTPCSPGVECSPDSSPSAIISPCSTHDTATAQHKQLCIEDRLYQHFHHHAFSPAPVLLAVDAAPTSSSLSAYATAATAAPLFGMSLRVRYSNQARLSQLLIVRAPPRFFSVAHADFLAVVDNLRKLVDHVQTLIIQMRKKPRKAQDHAPQTPLPDATPASRRTPPPAALLAHLRGLQRELHAATDDPMLPLPLAKSFAMSQLRIAVLAVHSFVRAELASASPSAPTHASGADMPAGSLASCLSPPLLTEILSVPRMVPAVDPHAPLHDSLMPQPPSVSNLFSDSCCTPLPSVATLGARVAALNEEQLAALTRALEARDYCIWQGLPGAGKTSVISLLVRLVHSMGGTCLVVAHTNSAVDGIMDKLLKEGGEPMAAACVRVGRGGYGTQRRAREHAAAAADATNRPSSTDVAPAQMATSVSDEPLPTTCSAGNTDATTSPSPATQVLSLPTGYHTPARASEAVLPHKRPLTTADVAVDTLLASLMPDENDAPVPSASAIETAATAFAQRTIVGSTILSLGAPAASLVALSSRQFDLIVVEEASQLTLPHCIAALRLLGPQGKVVFVGDTNQLPPLVQCARAREEGLGQSLFETLTLAHPQAVCRITAQYRMSAPIMALANTLVYGGAMRCATPQVASQVLPRVQLEHVLGEDARSAVRADVETALLPTQVVPDTPLGVSSPPTAFGNTTDALFQHAPCCCLDAVWKTPGLAPAQHSTVVSVSDAHSCTTAANASHPPHITEADVPLARKRNAPGTDTLSSAAPAAEALPKDADSTVVATATPPSHTEGMFTYKRRKLAKVSIVSFSESSVDAGLRAPTVIAEPLPASSPEKPVLTHRVPVEECSAAANVEPAAAASLPSEPSASPTRHPPVSSPHHSSATAPLCPRHWLRSALHSQRPVLLLDTAPLGRLAYDRRALAQASLPTLPLPAPVLAAAVAEGDLFNPAEAVIVLLLSVNALVAGVAPRDIVVITPFRAQVALLKALFAYVARKITQPEIAVSLGAPAQQLSVLRTLVSLRVYSVDQCQGMDVPMAVLSCVRANADRRAGRLLQDWRRANVALTRAQKKMILVAHTPTMAHQRAHPIILRGMPSPPCASPIASVALPTSPAMLSPATPYGVTPHTGAASPPGRNSCPTPTSFTNALPPPAAGGVLGQCAALLSTQGTAIGVCAASLFGVDEVCRLWCDSHVLEAWARRARSFRLNWQSGTVKDGAPTPGASYGGNAAPTLHHHKAESAGDDVVSPSTLVVRAELLAFVASADEAAINSAMRREARAARRRSEDNMFVVELLVCILGVCGEDK